MKTTNQILLVIIVALASALIVTHAQLTTLNSAVESAETFHRAGGFCGKIEIGLAHESF